VLFYFYKLTVNSLIIKVFNTKTFSYSKKVANVDFFFTFSNVKLTLMGQFFFKILLFTAVSCCFQNGFSQVGINTTTPLSTLDINGNLTIKEIGIVNANVAGSAVFWGGAPDYATPISDGVYISLTPTSGSDQFILPNAVNVPGRIYILRNISDTVDAKIYTFGGSFFAKNSNGATGAPLIMPSNNGIKTIIVISDGNNWTYIF